MREPAISVCIPSVRPGTLEHCLRALAAQTWADWEAVVIGQGPRGEELRDVVETASTSDARIRYIHLEKCGVSLARNAGIRTTTGELIAFTDDDCEPAVDWLSRLVDQFNGDPTLGLVGGSMICPPRSRRRPSTCPAITPTNSVYRPGPGVAPPPGWDWIGGNFAIRRAVVETVGGFDIELGGGTDYPIGEDTDLKLRLESARVPMLTTPECIVSHTYGRRYGFRNIFKHLRNYALGNGALAAKLTLMGDPRGDEWRRTTRSECLHSWMPIRIHRIPSNLYRLYNWNKGYRDCCTHFEVPVGSSFLQRREVTKR